MRSTILINGNESPRELSQKIMDIQRSLDNRLSAVEKKQAEIENRLEDLED